MAGYLAIDSALIKFEVEHHTNYHCIVCKAEFFTREARNQHLETHFIHRSCEKCHKAVIIIGDLEFELHRPAHCDQTKTCDNISSSLSTAFRIEASNEDEENNENEVKICVKPKTDQTKINYNENIGSDGLAVSLKRRNTQKRSKKLKTLKPEHVDDSRNTEYDLGRPEDIDDKCSNDNINKSGSGHESDGFKQIASEKKKRRRQYAKLPKTVPCTMCKEKFGSERTVKIHLRKNHGIKERHICPICSREFKISGNLKQHIETHSDHKRFICNYCGKGFHLPYNLKEHMNTHTGARPYTCETCGKTFGRNTLKQAHMRIHTGEKPYKCTEENCDRAYAYQTDLKRHKRSKHGIFTKTFPCTICTKVFYENKFLTKHMQLHRS